MCYLKQLSIITFETQQIKTGGMFQITKKNQCFSKQYCNKSQLVFFFLFRFILVRRFANVIRSAWFNKHGLEIVDTSTCGKKLLNLRISATNCTMSQEYSILLSWYPISFLNDNICILCNTCLVSRTFADFSILPIYSWMLSYLNNCAENNRCKSEGVMGEDSVLTSHPSSAILFWADKETCDHNCTSRDWCSCFASEAHSKWVSLQSLFRNWWFGRSIIRFKFRSPLRRHRWGKQMITQYLVIYNRRLHTSKQIQFSKFRSETVDWPASSWVKKNR